MKYRILNQITKEMYNQILVIAFDVSSYFSVCTFKNYHKKDLSNKYFQFLESIKNYQYDEFDFYLPQHYQRGQKFNVYELNKTTKKMIKEIGSIQSWSPPDLPEDLSFYIQKKVWFSSITHEQLYYIYSQDKQIIDKLRNCGFDLFEEP